MTDVCLLTRVEAAERVRICPRTLRRLISENRGPIVTKIGRKQFVRPEHLVAWIDRCAEPHNPDPATLFPAQEPSHGA